jgi:PAS domain S-box-containing protein
VSDETSPAFTFFRVLYDELPQGVIIIRENKVEYVNQTLAAISGYPLEEIQNWTLGHFIDVLFGEDQERVGRLYEESKARKGELDKLTLRFRKPQGEVRVIEVIPTSIVTDGEHFLHAIISDVTERVRMDEAIRQSEQQFRNTFNAIPDPAYLFEREPNGKIVLTMVNDYLRESTMDAINDFIDNGPGVLFAQTPELIELIKRTMDSGESQKQEILVSTDQNPKRRWVIADVAKPAPNTVLLITTDITDVREAREQARESEREKLVILDSMLDHVTFYNSTDLMIVWTNKAAASSIGMEPEELVGKHCFELWQKRATACEGCPVVKAAESKQPEESEMTTPDGRVWLVRGYPVFDDNDTLVGLVEVTREVTDQKKTAMESHEARATAELFNDLMAHDLNNINQGVLASLELILLDPELEVKTRNQVEDALEQIRRGVGLISKVRKFSQIEREPKQLEVTDLFEVLSSAIALVKNSFSFRTIVVNSNLTRGSHYVMADDFLMDALYNILHNSVKHSKTFKAKVDVKARSLEKQGVVRIQITDHGPGIEESRKEAILGRLVQGQKSSSGMGLTLVRRIIERYGGEIIIKDRVKGRHERGVMIVITLPAPEW